MFREHNYAWQEILLLATWRVALLLAEFLELLTHEPLESSHHALHHQVFSSKSAIAHPDQGFRLFAQKLHRDRLLLVPRDGN